LEWAKKSWVALARHGLTAGSDEIEWTRVMVRLMALATIYKEFCDLAWEEWDEPMYPVWTESLDIVPYRVVLCVGKDYARDLDGDECALLHSALTELVDQARPAIYDALTSESGGTLRTSSHSGVQ
jgi:hypothetical protein